MKFNSLLFSLFLLTFIACKEEDPIIPPVDCSTISLDATIESEDFEVYKGESATLTITGTPNSLVKMEDGIIVSGIIIGPTGVTSIAVTPEMGTSYRLIFISTESGECETQINSTAVVLVKPNPFSNVILETWNVRNDTFGSAANTVTFNADGTGTAPGVSDSAFSQQNPDAGNIYSENFTWTYASGSSTLDISYKYSSTNSTIERSYDVQEFSTSKVVVVEKFGDENLYILRS